MLRWFTVLPFVVSVILPCITVAQQSSVQWRLVDPGKCVGTHCTFEILSPCYSYDDVVPRCFSHINAELTVAWQSRANNQKTWRTNSAGPQIWDRGDGSWAFRISTATKALQMSYKFAVTVYPSGEANKDKDPGITLRLEKEVCTTSCDNFEPLETFKEHLQCGQQLPQQVIHDFTEKLPKITAEMIDQVEKMQHSGCVVHYTILDNKVYYRKVGNMGICGFSEFAHTQVLMLSRLVKLPDVEFVLNLGDWPLSTKRNGFPAMVSWCGSDSTKDVIIPTWSTSQYLQQSAVEDIYRMDMEVATKGAPWSRKIEKAFFRGRDANRFRLDLVQQSLDHPEDIDAGITAWFFFRDKPEKEKFGVAERVPMAESNKYKYILNIDGTVAAYRFGTLLAGDSVVFKQKSEFYEWFYKDLEAWEHYVPLDRDLSNIRERVEWARNHDDQMRRIARNARMYARYKLRPQDMMCHWADFLYEYAKRMDFKPRLAEGMELLLNNTRYVHPVPEEKCTCVGA
eukprot:TRINITY_DN84902_c0_g1_i1.p1 TRINITY_DN84902_c0_g1~~TRINITY_DN84902_c0_g1_i1.p1  ORF type:complete len:511 (+),score=33.31 TRINITY_DN84902_c0_g1_i1:29-1561(+)